MLADQVASQLRRIRRDLGLHQEHVAGAIELSISAVSRLERGIRGLRVEQLVAWAGSLGYRVDVLLWKPVLPEQQWKPGTEAPALDDESLALLAEVAAVLPHLPPPARRALASEMRVWREETILAAALKG